MDIPAARVAILKAVAFLVNRFGSEADVFAHLTSALANLRDDPLRRVVAEEPEPVDEPAPEPEPLTAEEPVEQPRTRSPYRRR